MEFSETIRASSSKCIIVKEEPCLTEQAIESKSKEQYINYLDHSESCPKEQKMEMMEYFDGLNNEDASNSNFAISLKRRASDSLGDNGADSDILVDTGSVGAKMILSSDDTLLANCSTGNATLDWSVVKSKLLSGEFKINLKRGRSKAWDLFGPILNDVAEEIPNVVACKECCNIFKFSKNSTSNLIKHKCYIKINSNEEITTTEVGLGTKKEVVGIVTQWILENCRPIKMVEDSAFIKLSKYLIKVGAQYGPTVSTEKLLPHPTTIARNVDSLYQRCFNAVKADLKEIKNYGYGLTADLWTENYLNTSYLSLTVHYIKDGELTKRFLGLKSMGTESCTDEEVLVKIQNILLDFDCNLNNGIVVTDGCSNMATAFRHRNNRINCVNQLLHNALEKSLKNVSEIAELCRKCLRVVKFLKNCGTNTALSTTLQSFSCTRWNTTYYLLLSIEKNWIEVKKILQEKNELQKMNDIKLNTISALVKFLQTIEESSKTLESENHSTICLAIVHVYRLRRTCNIGTSDIDVIKSLKEQLNTLLEPEILQKLSIFHKIALFLFPPANKLSQYSETERIEVKEECKRIMKNFSDLTAQIPSSSSNVSSRTAELFSGFVKPNEFLTTEDKINSEMQIYENTNVVLHDGFNVLHWWHSHRAEFPFLYKMSCKVLATPASSSASARNFSKARNLISEKYSSTGFNPVSVNKIMFLHSNLNESNLRCELKNKDNIIL